MVEEHGVYLIADFRKIYGLSVTDVDRSVDIFEGLALVSALAVYPDSLVGARMNGWKHPVHPLFPAIADLIDVTVAAIPSKKKKKFTYQRPYKKQTALTQAYSANKGRAKAVSKELFHRLQQSRNRRLIKAEDV